MAMIEKGIQVSLERDGLRLPGGREPLLAGEFHFWRQQRRFWDPTLDAMRRSGLKIVSTFVCWDFHEPEPGQFDFTGETAPERDLVGFLEACVRMDMRVILRPGPIIDAEWETRGPARDVCTLERNDPRFLDRARAYLAAVARTVAPFQATQGGPIILVAVDNEIFFPYNSDYSWYEEDGDVFVPYKRDFAAATYRAWLREQYGDIEQLNGALSTSYSTFDEIDVPNYGSDPRNALLASFRCIDDYCARYLKDLADVLRRGGIEVPLYTNQKQFLAYLDWKVVGRALDSVGLNLCMPNLLPARQALTVSWFIRLQRMRPEFPWSPEYQAGWIGFDEMYGVITAEHGLYMGLLGGALGLRGMSFFMFVERDDWNWSPINSFGKIRPRRFDAYTKLIEVVRALPSDDVHLADIGLLWSLDEHRLHLAATTDGWQDLFKHWMLLDEEKEPARWWRAFRALHDADADFRLVDIDGEVEEWPPVLIYAGSEKIADDRFRSACAAGKTIICAGPLDHDAFVSLAAAGSVVTSTPGGAADAAVKAGAQEYLRCGAGLWSFVYRAGDDSLTIFVVNPTDTSLGLEPSGQVVESDGPWQELVSGKAGTGGLRGAASGGDPTVAAKSVRVYRLEMR